MARKADGKPGNSLMDQQWIKEHADSLVTIEDGDHAGMMEYDGDPEQKGSHWTLPRNADRCTASSYIRDDNGHYVIDKSDGKRLRRPCYAWKMAGANVCLNHGGGSDAARQKARERLLAAASGAAGILVAIATNKKTPVKERLRALDSILDRAGLRAGVEVLIEDPKYKGVWDTFRKSLGVQIDEDGEEPADDEG